jgi:hypothetical protein
MSVSNKRGRGTPDRSRYSTSTRGSQDRDSGQTKRSRVLRQAADVWQSPFRVVDILRGRFGRTRKERLEYDLRNKPAPPPLTANGEILMSILDGIDNMSRIEPADIEGIVAERINRLTETDAKEAFRAINVLGAYLAAKVYDKRYGQVFCDDIEEASQYWAPGSVFRGPVIEQQMDPNIPIDSLDLMNSVHGPAIAKERPFTLLAQDPLKLTRCLILPHTTFSGSGRGQPRAGEEHLYAQLINAEDELPAGTDWSALSGSEEIAIPLPRTIATSAVLIQSGMIWRVIVRCVLV